MALHPMMWDLVGRAVGKHAKRLLQAPVQRIDVDTPHHISRVVFCALHQRLADRNLMPCFGHTGIVDTAAQLMDKEWPVMPAANIFLARPDDLHRHGLAHCSLNSFNRVVRGLAGTPAEATPHQWPMNRDILLRDPQKTRDHLLIVGLVLRTTPDCAGIAFDLSDAVHRLQRGVSQERHFVGRLNDLIRRIQDTPRVTNVFRQYAGRVS